MGKHKEIDWAQKIADKGKGAQLIMDEIRNQCSAAIDATRHGSLGGLTTGTRLAATVSGAMEALIILIFEKPLTKIPIEKVDAFIEWCWDSTLAMEEGGIDA